MQNYEKEMYLTGQEALVIKKAVREGNASRVSDTRGTNISDGGGTERGVGGEGVEKEIIQQSRQERGGG